MSFTVAENIELVRDVASGLPDDAYDPEIHEQNVAYCVFDAVNLVWLDVPAED